MVVDQIVNACIRVFWYVLRVLSVQAVYVLRVLSVDGILLF
jgi:hypothetical protein